MHIDNDDECTIVTLMPTFLLHAKQKVVAVDEPVDEGEMKRGGGGGREYVARENSREVK